MALVKFRVREGFGSKDAERYAFVWGGGKLGNCPWREVDLSDEQVEVLRRAGIFEFAGEPVPRRLVKLIAGREVDITHRRRVVLTASPGRT